ncbi:MAG TPA: hypothetical protein VMW87_06140 [Spirochaetia bacterium]|nr:hypothetical protein [Spirochaetia bacterium]
MKDRATDTYRTRIQQLEREIRVNQSVIEDELKNIGEIVVQERPPVVSDSGIADNLDECASCQKEIEQKRGQIERIKIITSRIQEIESKVAKSEAEAKRLVQLNTPHYEKIGHAAFEYYQENPFTDQEYADVFSELVQNHNELSQLENSIKENESQIGDRPLFDRMVLRGKTALLKSRRQAKLNAFPRMFRTAGEKISATEFMSMAQDETISTVAGPFLDNVRKIDALRASAEKLRQEESRLEEELEALADGRKAQRRIGELENGLKEDHLHLTQIYRQIGRRYRQIIGENGNTAPPNVEEYLRSIADTEKENVSRSLAIERLAAAIEIDRLDRETAHMQGTIHTLEEQISRQQDEIASLNGKIGEAEQQKRKLVKTRGPEEKLIEL